MTNQQLSIVAQVLKAIVETVRETGERGAPGGHLYAALMGQGMSLHTFEQVMSALVTAGKLTKRGQCYFAA